MVIQEIRNKLEQGVYLFREGKYIPVHDRDIFDSNKLFICSCFGLDKCTIEYESTHKIFWGRSERFLIEIVRYPDSWRPGCILDLSGIKKCEF